MRIKINGIIIPNELKELYDFFEIEAFCPNDLKLVDGESVALDINSPGGYIYPASEIYTALMRHKGEVIITITGRAASAASVIAMAGTHVIISPTAQMMIHNVQGRVSGDYRDLEQGAEVLKKCNDTIANAYMLKTGLQKDRLFELMNAETWFTPQEAIQLGFADEILGFSDDLAAEQEALKLLEVKGRFI